MKVTKESFLIKLAQMNREPSNNYNTDLEESSCSEDGEVPPLKDDLD
jgi:hypothetical protein